MRYVARSKVQFTDPSFSSYDASMVRVVKRSLSFPPDVLEGLVAEAAARGTTVSALMTGAAEDLLRRRRGLVALAEWEAEHGAFSEDELAEADRLIDEA